MDEKPVVLHADVRPPRPMRPGRIARRDCEYQRRGTANVFCGVEPKAGRHFTKATPNRSSPQFADYLLEIAASYPQADTIRTPNLGELALGFPRPKPVVKDFVPRTETENYRI